MCREAFDDFVRFLRDKEVNSQVYKKLTKKGKVDCFISTQQMCVDMIEDIKSNPYALFDKTWFLFLPKDL